MESLSHSTGATALAVALAAAFPLASFAQTAALKETVVTATRSATRADELVSDVKVVDRQAIEDSTARTLPELLARTAGVQMSATGSVGKTSSVFIRGAENRHTILLVDGVRLGSATSGNPSWDSIPVDMIDRIEILKGPASALYGSEGVGGVVQIFLRKGRDGFHPEASVTLGAHHYSRAGASLHAGQGPLGYSVGVQRLREKGFSSTNPRVPFGNHNPDRDPFEQDAVNAGVRYEIGKGWSVDAGLLYADGINWFDDGPGFNSRNAVRALTAHAGIKGTPMQAWQTELRLNQGNDTNNTLEASFPGAFKTEQSQWTWQNNIDTPLGLILAGLEQRVQKISATTAYAVTRRTIDSAFGGVNGSLGNHSWQLNLRHDTNSQFGGSDTGFIGYGYRIAPAWRVHASHGTSFVAPSFNQLYFPNFGNPNLQPERGRNTDVGVTWTSGRHEVKLVRFDNKIRGFMTNTTLPVNVPHARIEGWSLGYEGAAGAFALRASFDALDPRNEVSGKQLPRRAKTQATLGADWQAGAWRFGGSLLHVADRWDDAANTLFLPAYTTSDLYADWQFTPALSLQAKLNNVTDRKYETAFGYNQAGRSLYVTLLWQPK
jgi:vitamin B12 transporter